MWDQRYSEPGFAYGTEPNDFLLETYQRIPAGGRVLCLAEGEGRNAVFLAQMGYEVTAIDLSEVGLKKAKQFACDKGVTITTQLADLADYPFGEQQWDGIVSIWAHTPKEIRQHVHAQISTALKTNGAFILEAYTPEQPSMSGVGGPPATQTGMFMSLDSLRSELGSLNEIVAIEKHRNVMEGSSHQGMSAVVQYVACKKD